MPSEQPREGTRAEGLVPTESLREAIEQCREMEDPHRYHMLCAKIMSRISCATAPEEPAQPQPRGEGDDLAARLEEKARAESDEFGNYHDRYAEGPALPEPPRIESAPARVDPSEVADTRTIEQKLEDWAHDLAHSRVFNGAAPVCREAAALIADLRQTCADQGAAYHALAERLAERSNRDFVACTAAGAEGVRMGVALAEATSGSCTCGRLQLVPEQHKPECPVYRPAQTAPPEQPTRVDQRMLMNRWREHLGDDPLDGFGGRGPAEYHYMATHEPEGPGLTRFGNLQLPDDPAARIDPRADEFVAEYRRGWADGYDARASTHPEQWVSGDDREWLLWITSYVLNRHEFTDSAATDARAALTRIATAIKQPPTPTEQGEGRTRVEWHDGIEHGDELALRQLAADIGCGIPYGCQPSVGKWYAAALDRVLDRLLPLDPAPEHRTEADNSKEER